jgi:hypothetical protein
MISLEKIVQQLQQCKDTSINLPASNDSIFSQKTAIEIRKLELELLNNNFELLTEANYTMDNELEKNYNISNTISNNDSIIKNNKSNKSNNNTNNNITRMNQEHIPNKSLIIYMENETANLPEILLTLLNSFKNIINIKPSEWYIYGVKNPESFYKSFLLLSKIDFIIKNKTEMKNEVATFKREMAMKYEDYYKTLNYRKLKFKHNDMIHNLTSIDNYTEFDVLQFAADYNKINVIILDIVSEKYIDIEYSNSLSNTSNASNTSNTSNTSEFIIIIKYAANTYLPLMNSNGKHSFSRNIIDIISKHFERIVLDNFKEPRMIINNNDNLSLENTTDVVNNPNECEGHNLIYNIEDAFKTDLDTGLNSSLDTSLYSITLDSIITDTFISKITNPIENMIEIEEQEYEPMTMKNNNSNNNSITNTSITNLQNQHVSKVDDLASLLSKIPMSKPKPTKHNTGDNKICNKTVDISSDNSGKTDMEELKPLSKYNLVDLQMMSKFYKVDTQKMGTSGKKINKLKAELYDEIKAKM